MSRLDLIVFFFKKSDFVLLSFIWFLIYLSFDPLSSPSFHPSSSRSSLCSVSPSTPSSSSLQYFSRSPSSYSSILVGATKPHKPILQSDVIEDVDATRLFRMIEEEDYLAVFFCESSLSKLTTMLLNFLFISF